MLDDPVHMEDRPRPLFDVEKPKSCALMTALDQVDGRFGKKTIVLASEGMKRPCKLRSDHRGPRYTPRVSDCLSFAEQVVSPVDHSAVSIETDNQRPRWSYSEVACE